MNHEQNVARHYEHGSLESAILDALKAAGKDLDHLSHGDLALVDEFHIGGRPATKDLGDQIDLPPGSRCLDIGSGIGGPSRYFAAERGWKIDGIDLTPEYVEIAQRLSQRVGMGDTVTYRLGSATALPFADTTFDGAYMLHVGMNIPDKATVFAEVHRVLKPGGIFAIYDVMREGEGEGEISYPVPWASEPATSHLESAASYETMLRTAGFTIVKKRSRREFALESMRRRATQAGPPGLGLPIVMGPTAAQKLANMAAMIERGIFAPTEMISRAE
ncbi:MAG: class I SAM-dependent methyltransferase [Proteobacteria bacterium]|nr:class I SAM-dependent methyltransferase [Pseudomonadota bacterium]